MTPAAVLRASDACWFCLDGRPVQVRDGRPTCERCAAAFREAAASPAPAFSCPCGRVHLSAAGLLVRGWQSLYDGTAALLVNCRCGSTIVASVHPIEQTPIAHERAAELAGEEQASQ